MSFPKGNPGMGLSMEASQRLGLEMHIAPQIIQSIEILTMPILELETYIQQQLEDNPVLETPDTLEEDSEVQAEDKDGIAPTTTSNSNNEIPKQNNTEKTTSLDEEQLNSFDNLEYDDWDDVYNQDRGVKRGDDKDKKLEAMQNSADRPISLQDHLFQQFQLSEIPENIRLVGEQIIYNIDSNGYLRYTLEDIVKDVPLETLEKALYYVQHLEPAGIAARNIQECLILQLRESDPDYNLKYELITKYLPDIYHNRYPKISKEVGRSIEEIKLIVEEIKKLNPKPGSDFSMEKSQIIVPDVIVERINGEYIIRMEEEYLPHLCISPYYKNILDTDKQDPKAKEFIRKKMESAKWIIDAIQQRQNTLYRVVYEVVQRQKDFLDHGLSHLRPLKMQDVAITLGVHVSTISRAITAKYIQTPRGIFPIKFFFSGSVEKKEGAESESRVSVKQRVQEMIAQEDKNNPLSDEEIVEKLKACGLDIARRTITKYRKVLKIPSSRRRKQY